MFTAKAADGLREAEGRCSEGLATPMGPSFGVAVGPTYPLWAPLKGLVQAVAELLGLPCLPEDALTQGMLILSHGIAIVTTSGLRNALSTISQPYKGPRGPQCKGLMGPRPHRDSQI